MSLADHYRNRGPDEPFVKYWLVGFQHILWACDEDLIYDKELKRLGFMAAESFLEEVRWALDPDENKA